MYEDRVIKSIFDQSGIKPNGAVAYNTTPTAETPDLMIKATGDPKKGFDTGALANGAAGAAGGILQGLGTFKGLTDMDTSVESGGVMSKDDATLSGAAGGASMGHSIGNAIVPGLGGIIGGGIGAIGGAVFGRAKQKKALSEYRDNVQVDNLAKHAEERAKREKSYYMEKGLADIQNLKSMKEKSLGII